MERQIDKSKHLIFEHDTYQANIEALRQDLKDKKKIVLFVGAGINLGGDSSIDISWNGLLNMMLKDALSILSAEKRYTIKEKERLENLLCSSQRIGLRTEEEQSLWETLHTTVEGEFTSLVRASIIKSILGKNYIHTIRHQLYRYCDKDKMTEIFLEHYGPGKESKEGAPSLNSLYQLARFILLYGPLVAVVTYNYDKFLTMAVEVLYENKDIFFSEKEQEMLMGNKRWKNGVRIEEVYGNFNNSQQADNILPIYHIHGYLPPFNEPFLSDGNEIVLSMEEYYDNVRNVYSWQTATQLHFLCHFTCMFVGISLSDINPQRMVHYASSIGNEDKIYFLHASTKNYLKETQAEDYKSYVQIMEIKDAFFTNYGLTPIFELGGYKELYNHIFSVVWDKE